MVKKIISVFIALICMLSCCVNAFAEDTTRYRLPLNPENRYTDISDMDENNRLIFGSTEEEEETADGNKMVYIIVLCVLLVIAIAVLVISLKRAGNVEVEDNKKPEKKSADKGLKDEEKDDEKSSQKKADNKGKGSDTKKASKGKKK